MNTLFNLKISKTWLILLLIALFLVLGILFFEFGENYGRTLAK